MTGIQLPLFEPGVELTFVAVCPFCGQPLSKVEVEDAGEPWLEPVLWSYLATREHIEESHASP